MATEDAPKIKGIEMSDGEIEAALEELGHGTLSLAREGEAYAVPISFGYDGERLFMDLLQFGDESKKLVFSDATEAACLTAYEAASRFNWRSVIVTGPLTDVPEDETKYVDEVMDDNAWFPTIYPPTDPLKKVRRTELEIADATGRKGEAQQ